MIGIIALTGIVLNDAIVMIETMNSHRDQGMLIRDAAARSLIIPWISLTDKYLLNQFTS